MTDLIQVRLLESARAYPGGPRLNSGETIDVPLQVAQRWIAQGIAVAAADGPPADTMMKRAAVVKGRPAV